MNVPVQGLMSNTRFALTRRNEKGNYSTGKGRLIPVAVDEQK